MASQVLIGTSGWKYDDPIEKSSWIGVFYPDEKTRFLKFYSYFSKTAEFDAVFYRPVRPDEQGHVYWAEQSDARTF